MWIKSDANGIEPLLDIGCLLHITVSRTFRATTTLNVTYLIVKQQRRCRRLLFV
jgi:hypothetical protein